jgi:fermentation-respiration switch protein FrsA (DUF1100 family)
LEALDHTVWRTGVKVVLAIFLLYTVLATMLFLFQSHLLYFPHRTLVSTPEMLGLRYTAVTLVTTDGFRLSAWYIPGAPEAAVILFCHGNGGNISYLGGPIRQYHDLGFSTLVFDYRGYGESEGTPDEEGTYRDAQAAWDYLVKERSIPPSRIIVIGRSLGGAVAARLARKQTPAALVLESSFTSVPDIAADVYWYFPVRLLSRFRYETSDHVRDARCPVLVVHSPDDEIIPYHHGRTLFDRAPGPKEFLEIGGSHNEGFFLSEAKYQQGLRTFITTHLRRQPSRPDDEKPLPAPL